MNKKGNCPVCGKEVAVSDVRDLNYSNPSFCSKVCATNVVYRGERFKGSAESEKTALAELLNRKAY